MADTSNRANILAKTLFIIGGIILFILLALFIIRLVPVAVSKISELGTSIKSGISNTLKGDEEIILTTNTDSIDAGSPLIINFEYTPTVPGQYFVLYACYDGLFFDIQSSNGAKRIICNTPFKLGENLEAISLIPVVTKSNIFIDSTITIEYKDPEGNPIAKGTKLVTIKSEAAGETATSTSTQENPFNTSGTAQGTVVTTSSVASKPVAQPTTSYVSRTKDLAITYIYQLEDESAFVFHVYNLGNTTVGPWEFSYTDAQNPSRTLISPVQASLAGGQGLAITVKTGGQKNSSQLISIFADPYNQVAESNESNNTASVTITGDRSGNSDDSSYDSNDDADLVITEMQVGRMSGSKFVSDDELDEDDTAAVRFMVKNQGGESTGSWKFEIDNLPYDNDDTYESKTYSSLKPGQSLEVIAEFDGIDEGDYSIRVEVDSDDDVDEESENNNTKTKSLEVKR